MPYAKSGKGEKLIIAHFGELWLRGNNRSHYISLLIKNLKTQLRGIDYSMRCDFDRLIIRPADSSGIEPIKRRIGMVFGIRNLEVADYTAPELSKIISLSKSRMSEMPKGTKIKINSHRSYKELPFNSIDIINRLRKEAEDIGLEPTTDGYDSEIYVNVTRDAAYVHLGKEDCLGGLPTGSSGKGVVLISGGIDSPVAAWYAMKRGVSPVYVHIHAFNNKEEIERSKMPRIISILSSYYGHYKAYYVPSHIFQIAAAGTGDYELVLLKLFMLRVAEKIAKVEEANLIFTGESLGQVASQTAENLLAEQQGIKMPILRPLIGYDKEEIVNLARRVGTYEESIKEYRDVCSINARRPKTKAKEAKISELAKRIRMRSIVSRSVREAFVVRSNDERI